MLATLQRPQKRPRRRAIAVSLLAVGACQGLVQGQDRTKALTDKAPQTEVWVRDIRRTETAETVRVTIELDREVVYAEHRLSNPDRVFFDLKKTRVPAALADAVLTYKDEIVRQIRVGRRPDRVTRVVLDLERAGPYSVFSLYNPFRLVIDVERTVKTVKLADEPAPVLFREPSGLDAVRATEEPALPLPATASAPAALPAPLVPSTNTAGGFSLSRQLGLGVARIVIDPGHGGHDPGATGSKMSEAQLVLDVALRLERLLLRQPGFEVILTRRGDVFQPLEERTALANRSGADLFLSIHANASPNRSARGVETYYLNFASTPEAAAVAARENASSSQTMGRLPDLLKAIALNNKLDESRDFAALIQQSLARGLRGPNKQLRDLGVKQAPFVVLIGASMPSVLAEISFLTNKEDGQLLRTESYRQKIAQALADGVLQYRRSLKAQRTLAQQ